MSFQTIIVTGLRVSELAQLGPDNCTIADGSITFNFIGKGGVSGSAAISSLENPQLCERLKQLIEDTPKDKKVFYSAAYLQAKAKELGFGCHDLRRAYAKLEYRKCRNKAEVQRKLRHSNLKTTNIYLRSKIKI